MSKEIEYFHVPTATQKAIQRDGRIAIWVMRLFCKLDLPDGIRLHDGRPVLACGNHQSLLDVFCAAAFCASTGVSCRFLVQARYFKNPILGRWLRRIGCIPLNSKTKRSAFVEARAALERGELVGIMPEGRLTPPSERTPQVGPARPGAAELAGSVNAWMRPICFHNTGTVWPRDKWPRPRLRRPTVTLRLGDAHFESTDDAQADIDQVMAALTDMLTELDTRLEGS